MLRSYCAGLLLCCRWGYANMSVLQDVVSNYSAAGLPLETVWSDIEYMSNRFWTMEFDPRELQCCCWLSSR